jgi:hypothetical protein
LIAQIIVSKFGDHLPFYRQSEIYARQGIRLHRATLGNWTGRACFYLKPIADHMCAHLSAADRLFMVLVHCWSHWRRRFVKLVRNTKSPIAEAAVRQIATLYAVEATVRGTSPQVRLATRQQHSAPIIAALKPWFEKQLSMISSGLTLLFG